MMTLEMAQNVNTFCRNNNIRYMEVMGGEFFCHPRWEEVLDAVTNGMKSVRLVSNGDWAANEATAKKVVGFLQAHLDIHVGISKDQWHTNANVEAAAGYLQAGGVPFRIPTPEETKEDSIVPIGRGEFHFGFYSMLGNYCQKNDRRYNFLIDEIGDIFKCGLGAWPYDNVTNFLNGGFDARFKYFNEVFYKSFIMTCTQCRRAEAHSKKET